MLKRLILLLLCVPLGFALYDEGQGVVKQFAGDRFAPPGAPSAQADAGLVAAVKAAEGVKRLRPELTRVICVSDEVPANGAEQPGKGTPEAAIQEYCQILAGERGTWQKTMQELAALEIRIKDAKPEDQAGRTALRDLLQEYQKGGGNRSFAAPWQAALRRFELADEHVQKKLKERRDKILLATEAPVSGKAREEARRLKADLERAVSNLRDFVSNEAKPESAKPHRQWAEGQLAEWDCTLSLTRLSLDRSQLTIGACVLALGRLFEKASPDVRKLIRQVAQATCERHLPADLKLDDRVGVWSVTNKAYFPLKRGDVYVKLANWKDARPLDVSGYDEFSLRDLKEDYAVTVQGGSRDKELQPRPLSKAAHAYNALRGLAKMQWAPASLKQLADCCETYRQYLEQPLQRVRELQAAMTQLPEGCELFEAAR